jgi:hypothetical protein
MQAFGWPAQKCVRSLKAKKLFSQLTITLERHAELVEASLPLRQASSTKLERCFDKLSMTVSANSNSF